MRLLLLFWEMQQYIAELRLEIASVAQWTDQKAESSGPRGAPDLDLAQSHGIQSLEAPSSRTQ